MKIPRMLFLFLILLHVISAPAFSESELPCATCRPSPDVQTFLYLYGFSPTNLDLLSDKTVNFFRETMELTAKFSVHTAPVKSKKVLVKSGDYDIPVYVFSPEMQSPEIKPPIIMYIHGGGWTLGSTAVYGHVIRKLAAATPAIVISPDYRLAPESRFPVAVNDCYAVLQWIAQNPDEHGGDVSKLTVAGDSGGGNLATVMALKSMAENGPKVVFQSLFYPSVNIASVATDSAKCFSRGYILSLQSMFTFRSFYLPNETDWENPYASPLKAKDLSGLPPALITTAGCDPLLNEAEEYARRLKDAGVNVTYHLEPNIFHGYLGLLNVHPTLSGIAEKTLDRAAAAIREAVK